MAFIKVGKVAIRGISGCVPSNVEENKDLPFYSTPKEAAQVIVSTGIERRHVAEPGTTASDLCLKAAEKLVNELGWEKESIDLLAFCTQNPDYLNQPNSFVVHEKLGLSSNALCLDFYHGCPGWVVSLGAVGKIISSGEIKRALLLVGDTASKDQEASSREARPLFGDAGTATALEYDSEAAPMLFNYGTKSEDGMAIARTNGGYRHPFTIETLDKELKRLSGTLEPDQIFYRMDSMDIFSFAITKVPKALKALCTEMNLDIDTIDKLVLHQANKIIVDNIANKMKVPAEKVPLGLRNYGNTTSASIPLTMVSECSDEMRNGVVRNLVCGFGTGLAWGAAYFETNKIVCPEIIEI